jgi:hypothetical protein
MQHRARRDDQIIGKMPTMKEAGTDQDSQAPNIQQLLQEENEKPIFNEQTNYVPTGKIIMVKSVYYSHFL